MSNKKDTHVRDENLYSVPLDGHADDLLDELASEDLEGAVGGTRFVEINRGASAGRFAKLTGGNDTIHPSLGHDYLAIKGGS